MSKESEFGPICDLEPMLNSSLVVGGGWFWKTNMIDTLQLSCHSVHRKLCGQLTFPADLRPVAFLEVSYNVLEAKSAGCV